MNKVFRCINVCVEIALDIRGLQTPFQSQRQFVDDEHQAWFLRRQGTALTARKRGEKKTLEILYRPWTALKIFTPSESGRRNWVAPLGKSSWFGGLPRVILGKLLIIVNLWHQLLNSVPYMYWFFWREKQKVRARRGVLVSRWELLLCQSLDLFWQGPADRLWELGGAGSVHTGRRLCKEPRT